MMKTVIVFLIILHAAFAPASQRLKPVPLPEPLGPIKTGAPNPDISGKEKPGTAAPVHPPIAQSHLSLPGHSALPLKSKPDFKSSAPKLSTGVDMASSAGKGSNSVKPSSAIKFKSSTKNHWTKRMQSTSHKRPTTLKKTPSTVNNVTTNSTNSRWASNHTSAIKTTSQKQSKNSTSTMMHHSNNHSTGISRTKLGSEKRSSNVLNRYWTKESPQLMSLDAVTIVPDAKPQIGSALSPNLNINYALDIDLVWMNASNYVPNSTLGWVCISHFKKFLLFHPNNTRPASAGLKQLAETGNNTLLMSEFQGWLNEKQIGSVFYLPQYRQSSPSTATMIVAVSVEYPMISCAARLEPSTDWFTGLINVNLVPNKSEFLETAQVELDAYDAGTAAMNTSTGAYVAEHGNVTTVKDSKVQGQIGFATFGIA